MMEGLKEKVVAKGIKLLNSPLVAKAMESEQVGVMIEKAMSLPIKVSEGIRSNRDRITGFMELATRADIDELKRTVCRLEDELKSVQSTPAPAEPVARPSRTPSRAKKK